MATVCAETVVEVDLLDTVVEHDAHAVTVETVDTTATVVEVDGQQCVVEHEVTTVTTDPVPVEIIVEYSTRTVTLEHTCSPTITTTAGLPVTGPTKVWADQATGEVLVEGAGAYPIGTLTSTWDGTSHTIVDTVTGQTVAVLAAGDLLDQAGTPVGDGPTGDTYLQTVVAPLDEDLNLTYNPDGTLASVAFDHGETLTLTYGADGLSTVTSDQTGPVAALTYTTGKLSRVEFG